MKNEISRTQKNNRILSTLTIVIGLILMIYMIKVEDEPGALPLFLVLSGIIWFLINHYQIRKQVRKNYK